jgi:hypothetical protein
MNNKKFNYTYLLLAVLSILFVKCNKGPEFDKLIPYKDSEDGRWGYVNYKGRKKIETIFANQPSLFYEGMALVHNMDGTYDFINRKGIDMGRSFKYATRFEGGVACVVEEDKHPVIINRNMEVIARLDSIEKVSGFYEGLAAFMNNKDKWGFINAKGETVIKPVYDNVGFFNEGLALVEKKTEEFDSTKNEKKTRITMGYINRKGDEVIRLNDKFDDLSSFSEGMAAYSDGPAWGWGFINKKGKKVIRAKAEWDDVTLFQNGFSSVNNDGNWGLINKRGKIVIKPRYYHSLSFSNGLAGVDIDDKIGFINSKGKIVIEPDYEEVAIPFYSGKAFVRDNMYYKIINRKGKPADDVELYDISSYSDYDYIVNSDYFDVNPILDTVLPELSPNSVIGLNGKSNVKAVMDKFKIPEDDLPQNTWREYISLNSIDIKDATIYRTVYFKANVSDPIQKRVRYSYYYSYMETVGYRPNSRSYVESLKFEINLTDRGTDKQEKLASALKRLLEANGYKSTGESKQNIFVMLNQGGDCKAIVDYDEDSEVTLSFNF